MPTCWLDALVACFPMDGFLCNLLEFKLFEVNPSHLSSFSFLKLSLKPDLVPIFPVLATMRGSQLAAVWPLLLRLLTVRANFVLEVHRMAKYEWLPLVLFIGCWLWLRTIMRDGGTEKWLSHAALGGWSKPFNIFNIRLHPWLPRGRIDWIVHSSSAWMASLA